MAERPWRFESSLAHMTTYFISGHLDLTEEEFAEHYEERISKAFREGAMFVVGDARGADDLAQLHLFGLICSRESHLSGRNGFDQVTVFHMLNKPRHCIGGLTLLGGFLTDGLRDQAMTAASDKDIAWVRPGREKSGTARNLKRRITHA